MAKKYHLRQQKVSTQVQPPFDFRSVDPTARSHVGRDAAR